jgi:uncharacterized phage protein (TIGR01671 family)
MREILFRGKRADNGAWVEGAFCLKDCDEPFGDLVDRPSIIKYDPPCDGFWYRVDPKTAGQFTGLTDKNGKKIFEGDILQYSIEEDQAVFVGAVKFGEFNPDGGALINTSVGFYVELVDQEGKRTYMRKDIGFWVKFRGVEVIGNVHDNPELLEGSG